MKASSLLLREKTVLEVINFIVTVFEIPVGGRGTPPIKMTGLTKPPITATGVLVVPFRCLGRLLICHSVESS